MNLDHSTEVFERTLKDLARVIETDLEIYLLCGKTASLNMWKNTYQGKQFLAVSLRELNDLYKPIFKEFCS